MTRAASIRTGALLLGALGVALLLRSAYATQVVIPGGLLPPDPDSAYHLWRIETAVETGTAPRRDPFVNAPAGATVIYPDGFDWGIASVARLFVGSGAGRPQIQWVAACLMPLLGALGVCIAFFIGRRLRGDAVGLVAAGFVAVSPMAIWHSMFARVDHHVVEMMLPCLAASLLVLGAERHRAWSAAAAAVLTALVYLVPTALLHIAIVAAAIAAAGLWASRDSGDATLLERSAAAFAGAALLMLPDALTRRGLHFYEPSWLAFTFTSSCAVALVVLGLGARRAGRARTAAIAAVALGAGTAAVALAGAAGFVTRGGAIGLLGESRPVWRGLWLALQMNTGLYFLFPALALALLSRSSVLGLALALVGLASFGLSLVQARFAVAVVVPLALATACALVESRRLGRAATLAAAALCALALAPSAQLLARVQLQGAKQHALLEVAGWLKANSPDPGPRTPGATAPYSVVVGWGSSNLIGYLARRPVVSSAMYHGDYAAGFREQLEMFHGDAASADLERALEARRARYLVVPYYSAGYERSIRDLLELGPAERPSVHSQLYFHDGSAVRLDDGRERAAQEHLGLVFESQADRAIGDRRMPYFKVFERLKGARISGGCDREVSAIVNHEVSGRALRFVTLAECADGRFELGVPYAGVVSVQAAERAVRIRVNEVAVRHGRTIELPAPLHTRSTPTRTPSASAPAANEARPAPLPGPREAIPSGPRE